MRSCPNCKSSSWPGKTKKGLDGKMWTSRLCSNGTYRWVPKRSITRNIPTNEDQSVPTKRRRSAPSKAKRNQIKSRIKDYRYKLFVHTILRDGMHKLIDKLNSSPEMQWEAGSLKNKFMTHKQWDKGKQVLEWYGRLLDDWEDGRCFQIDLSIVGMDSTLPVMQRMEYLLMIHHPSGLLDLRRLMRLNKNETPVQVFKDPEGDKIISEFIQTHEPPLDGQNLGEKIQAFYYMCATSPSDPETLTDLNSKYETYQQSKIDLYQQEIDSINKEAPTHRNLLALTLAKRKRGRLDPKQRAMIMKRPGAVKPDDSNRVFSRTKKES